MSFIDSQNIANNHKYICNSQIHQETNNRIYDRNIPSQMLQPYINVRPVMTKYSVLPIVDPRVATRVKLEQQPTYNTRNVFNPGNTQSPWSGFVNNVNVESQLRNQIFAHQKCSKAVYVPDSTSDLYQYNTPSKYVEQPFNNLFKKETFSSFNPNPNNMGHLKFNNSTRHQNREINTTTKQNNCV